MELQLASKVVMVRGSGSTWKTPTAKEKFPTRTWNWILGSYPSRFTRASPLARTTGHSDARLRRTRANKLCPARSCLTILKRTPEERSPELMAIMNSDLTAAGPRAAASLWTVWPLAARSFWLLSPAGSLYSSLVAATPGRDEFRTEDHLRALHVETVALQHIADRSRLHERQKLSRSLLIL